MQPERIVIPCELIIIPGGETRQNHIRLSASGETVADDFEEYVDKDTAAVAKKIAAAHSRMLSKWSQS